MKVHEALPWVMMGMKSETSLLLLFRAWRDKNPYTAVKNDLNQFDPQLETHQILLPEKIPWVRKKNL